MKHSVSIILLLAIIFAALACEPKVKSDFTPEEKVLFDSLRLVAFNNIRNNTDSLCKTVQDSFFNIYVDSLLALRREEIEALFKD